MPIKVIRLNFSQTNRFKSEFTYLSKCVKRFHSSVGQSIRLLTEGSRVRAPLEVLLMETSFLRPEGPSFCPRGYHFAQGAIIFALIGFNLWCAVGIHMFISEFTSNYQCPEVN